MLCVSSQASFVPLPLLSFLILSATKHRSFLFSHKDSLRLPLIDIYHPNTNGIQHRKKTSNTTKTNSINLPLNNPLIYILHPLEHSYPPTSCVNKSSSATQFANASTISTRWTRAQRLRVKTTASNDERPTLAPHVRNIRKTRITQVIDIHTQTPAMEQVAARAQGEMPMEVFAGIENNS